MKLTVFTVQRYIAAVYVIDLSLSVRLAVTSRSYTKTAIDIITKEHHALQHMEFSFLAPKIFGKNFHWGLP